MSSTPNLPSIFELNELLYEDFNSTISILFESAPPLGKHLYKVRPFSSYSSLIDFAESITLSENLNIQEKLEVINAHPRLGENKKKLSALSYKEQGYENTTTTIENASSGKSDENKNNDDLINEQLQQLNRKYEEKYGFRFVIFVNRRSREEIIPVLEERLKDGSKEQELETGFKEMFKIARDRLSNLGKE
ncbi:5558_t:CDS:2 [Ambispora gerdemannii]|uniref:5558_t:CDS:1 n=1 Tax=Ambispora gerdemannii TaxID=144530 RepID=A0A9N8W4F6_9GLOM|nr:5558_t:CDS:2 [Ambispora gerdemannii]